MPQPALGIPDPNRYTPTNKLDVGKLVDWVVQKHQAERAGLHSDVRMGTPDTGLLSWAVRKGLPTPGNKHLAIEQPTHSHEYKDFQGTIPSGYGKGRVSTEDKGQVLITRSSPNAVHFTLAHKSMPERFALVRTNQGKDGKGWLLINTTPTSTLPADKKRYVPVSAERAEHIMKHLPEGDSVQPKIDGANVLMPILKDKLEVVSYRQSKKTGGPITHTEKVFSKIPNPYDTNMPSSLRGSLLRGELYGTRDNQVIPPQELGGILNSSLAKSLKTQQDRNIDLKTSLFDIEQLGKKKIDSSTPYQERYKMLQSILPYLPKGKVDVMPQATNPEDALKMWNEIKNKTHPLSSEGVVIQPSTGTPMKAKLFDEADVHVKGVFPGEGKYQGTGAGGFTYSLSPEGQEVGRVGTGLSDETRRDMHTNPQNYIGRVAKITSQGQFPNTGAYRAPALHSFHEDLPMAPVKQADEDLDSYLRRRNIRLISSVLGTVAGLGTLSALNQRMGQQLSELPNTKKQFRNELLNISGLHKDTPMVPFRHYNTASWEDPHESTEFSDKKLTDKIKQHGLIAYDPTMNKPGILAHEMGHGTIRMQHPWYHPYRFNQSVLRPMSQLGSILVPGSIGLTAGMATGNPLIGLAAGGAAGGIVNAPTLINEWQASHRAGKYLNKLMPDDPAAVDKNKKTLRSAFGTYLAASTVPYAVGGGIAGLGAMLTKKAAKLDKRTLLAVLGLSAAGGATGLAYGLSRPEAAPVAPEPEQQEPEQQLPAPSIQPKPRFRRLPGPLPDTLPDEELLELGRRKWLA